MTSGEHPTPPPPDTHAHTKRVLADVYMPIGGCLLAILQLEGLAFSPVFVVIYYEWVTQRRPTSLYFHLTWSE